MYMKNHSLCDFKSLAYLFLKGINEIDEYKDLLNRYKLMGYVLPIAYFDIRDIKNDYIDVLLSLGIKGVEIEKLDDYQYHFVFETDLYFFVNSKSDYYDILQYDLDFEEYAYDLSLNINSLCYSFNLVSNDKNYIYSLDDKLFCDLLEFTNFNDIKIKEFIGKFLVNDILSYKLFLKLKPLGIIPMQEYLDSYRYSIFFNDFDDFMTFSRYYESNTDKFENNNINIYFNNHIGIYSNTELFMILFYIEKSTTVNKTKFKYIFAENTNLKISDENHKRILNLLDLGVKFEKL